MVYGISGFVNQVFTKITAEDYANNARANDSVVEAGDGQDFVQINGNGNSVDTGDGASNVYITGNSNAFSGGKDVDSAYIIGDNNSANLGDGDNQLALVGNNNNAKAGSGNDTFLIQGNGNTADMGDGDNYASVVGNNNNVSSGAGNDNVMIQGNGNTASTGAGADQALVLGDGNTLASTGGSSEFIAIGDYNTFSGVGGNNQFTFWGDHTSIRGGGGGSFVMETLDKALARGLYRNLGLEQYLDQDKIVEKQLLGTTTERIVLDSGVDINAIADQYHLSAQERAILQDLYDRGELGKTYSDGLPLYTIERSVKKSSAGNDVYVIGRRDGAKHTRAVSDNECIASDADWTLVMASEQMVADKTTTTYRNKESLNGCDYIDVQLDDCSSLYADFTLPFSNEHVEFKVGNVDKENYFVNMNNGSVSYTESYTEESISNQHSEIASLFYSNLTHTSPLIIDFNQDGVVSANAGLGVDLNNDGKADGAATNGDKMLAMSDINGNGKIDGAEVFGDQTVNPFTGEKINAANGFEALKEIAKSAESYTGIQCLNANGDVNLPALKKALATKGINLGFISDNNNTQLEELSKVESINVFNYKNQKDVGDVQHNQLGSAQFTDGGTVKVDDVWFKL